LKDAPDAFADAVLTPDTLQRRLAMMRVFVAMSDSGEVVGTIACHMAHSQFDSPRPMLPELESGDAVAEGLAIGTCRCGPPGPEPTAKHVWRRRGIRAIHGTLEPSRSASIN
jgi:hypothetical protein